MTRYHATIDGPVPFTLEEEAEWDAAEMAEEEARAIREQGRCIAMLWQAAHDYESSYINGMAIGLLTLGVVQNLPKALAVKQWSQSIWQLYYSRKAVITPSTASGFLDFSSVGAMPHSIPELMVEQGL